MREAKKSHASSGGEDQATRQERRRIGRELRKLVVENSEMRELIKEMKDELDYSKQRENKLMYFLYLLKEKGFPVNDVFEADIKNIPTERFSKYFEEMEGKLAARRRNRRHRSMSLRVFVGVDKQIAQLEGSMDLVSQRRGDVRRQAPLEEALRARKKEKRGRDVPSLNLSNLPLRQEHYFSVSSRGSAEGLDITHEELKMEKGKRLKKHGATKRMHELSAQAKGGSENPKQLVQSQKQERRNGLANEEKLA